MSDAYPCPCCGHLVFDEPPGSFEICPICFWEDDLVQLRWPDYEGGANRASLIEAQRYYAAHGACEPKCLPHVREASAEEPRDPTWRPVDPARDSFESLDDVGSDWPDDKTTLYWWADAFWRRPPGQ